MGEGGEAFGGVADIVAAGAGKIMIRRFYIDLQTLEVVGHDTRDGPRIDRADDAEGFVGGDVCRWFRIGEVDFDGIIACEASQFFGNKFAVAAAGE